MGGGFGMEYIFMGAQRSFAEIQNRLKRHRSETTAACTSTGFARHVPSFENERIFHGVSSRESACYKRERIKVINEKAAAWHSAPIIFIKR